MVTEYRKGNLQEFVDDVCEDEGREVHAVHDEELNTGAVDGPPSSCAGLFWRPQLSPFGVRIGRS